MVRRLTFKKKNNLSCNRKRIKNSTLFPLFVADVTLKQSQGNQVMYTGKAQ